MQSRRNGEFKRSVISALAAMVAAAVPSLVSSTALAEKRADKQVDKQEASDEPSKDAPVKNKPAKKPAGKAKAAPAKRDGKAAKADSDKSKSDKAPALSKVSKADKDSGKSSAQAKADKAEPSKAGNKASKTKKTAAREGGARARKPVGKVAKKDSDAPTRRCPGQSVWIDRGGLEGQNLALLDCHHRPVEAAQRALSVLARPWGAKKPGRSGGDVDPRKHLPALRPGEVAPGVRLLDKQLLARVDAIAHHFPGRSISLVSGYRPQSRGSQHQHGRALDLRVSGVPNEELVAFCRTLQDTGCGYYPNSSFVHVDARAGKVTWIDASGPGEAPRYVKSWPLAEGDSDNAVLGPDQAEQHLNDDPFALDPSDEHAAQPEGGRKGTPSHTTFPDLVGIL